MRNLVAFFTWLAAGGRWRFVTFPQFYVADKDATKVYSKQLGPCCNGCSLSNAEHKSLLALAASKYDPYQIKHLFLVKVSCAALLQLLRATG